MILHILEIIFKAQLYLAAGYNKPFNPADAGVLSEVQENERKATIKGWLGKSLPQMSHIYKHTNKSVKIKQRDSKNGFMRVPNLFAVSFHKSDKPPAS